MRDATIFEQLTEETNMGNIKHMGIFISESSRELLWSLRSDDLVDKQGFVDVRVECFRQVKKEKVDRADGAICTVAPGHSTPIQRFDSERLVLDVPKYGLGILLFIDKKGNYFGPVVFDPQNPDHASRFPPITPGCTMVWICASDLPFVFHEYCSPAYLREYVGYEDKIPHGDDAGNLTTIVPSDEDPNWQKLPEAFKEDYLRWMWSFEPLRRLKSLDEA